MAKNQEVLENEVVIDEKVLEQNEKVLENEIKKEELSMKEKLKKEKKVPIFIPEDPLNENDVVPVGVNGVIYAIPRGKSFEVPESIYKVWKYSYEKTIEANKKIKVGQQKEITIID